MMISHIYGPDSIYRLISWPCESLCLWKLRNKNKCETFSRKQKTLVKSSTIATKESIPKYLLCLLFWVGLKFSCYKRKTPSLSTAWWSTHWGRNCVSGKPEHMGAVCFSPCSLFGTTWLLLSLVDMRAFGKTLLFTLIVLPSLLWSTGLYSNSTADKATSLTHGNHVFQWRKIQLAELWEYMPFE